MSADRGTTRDDGGMRLVFGVGAGVVVAWLALLVGLVRRLAGDASLPRSTRVTLALLAGYLVFPIDVVPDFIPVLGYADDAIVVALALRRVVRAAGPEAIERHWRGSDAGMAVVRRLAGI